MRTLRNIGYGGLLLLLAAWPLAAQMGMRQNIPDWRGIFNPVVGSGAGYDMENNGEKHPVEISVVGKEDVNGKTGYWIEFGMNEPRMGGQMWMKYLFSVEGKNGVISRNIMQMPGRPPMEFDGMSTMIRGDRKSTSTDIRDDAELVGTEDVTVPAGTFSCDHYRAKDGSWNAWISTKVTPWGLVKYVSKENTLTLSRIITDAKDQITGTPQKFDPSQMMRGMGQRPQ